jgi:hypothetical protein
MRPSTRSALLTSALAILVGLALPQDRARAASPEAPAAAAGTSKAEELFKQGLAEYDAHRYRNAIDLFELAYRDSRAPALLFNMAQAWRLLGDCQRASELFSRFVVASPSSPDAERARTRLKELGDCGQAKPAAAEPPPPRPAAPPAAVIAQPVKPVSTHQPAQRSQARRFAALAFLGLSAACAGAAAVSAWDAQDAADRTSQLFRNGGTWDDGARATDERGGRSQTAAIVFLSGAVVSAGVAFLLHRWEAR